ncbi:MAG: protein kinase [Flavobacteriales bacterium]|nr:protein kinase [Flavobacteriales bacterium]
MLFSERYNYDPEKDFIGTGGFSKIFKAYDNLREETVALKFFSGDIKEKYGIIAEAKRLLKLNHPNVIRFYDLETVEFTNIHMQREKIIIGILEYVDGGDLKAAIPQQLSDTHKYQITRGLLDGLKYIHEKRLVHRDLKPGNIMLQHQNGGIIPKLIDFGISKQADEGTTVSSQLLGTVEYMAPEQFNPEKYGKISPATDLWSFAVMIYELYTGNRLFGSRGGGQQTEQVISKILLDELPPDFSALPNNINKLLTSCLVRNTKERVAGAAELIKMLDEPNDSAAPVEKKEDKSPQIKVTLPVPEVKSPIVKKETEKELKKEAVPKNENPKPEVKKAPVVVKKSVPKPLSDVGETPIRKRIVSDQTQVISTKKTVAPVQPTKTRKPRLVTPDAYTKTPPTKIYPQPATPTSSSSTTTPSAAGKPVKKKPQLLKIILIVAPIVIAVLILIIIFWIKSSNITAHLNKGKEAYLVANFYDAEQNFRLAFAGGDAEAAFFLGLMFLNGEIADWGGERTNERLINYINENQIYLSENEMDTTDLSITAELLIPTMMVGERYRDSDSADYFFNLAAEEGEPYISYSNYMLGNMKNHGSRNLDLEAFNLEEEVDELYKSSLDVILEKANEGDQIFMNFVALSYLGGLGVEKDTAVAIDWLEQSIDSSKSKGYKRSLVDLGGIYYYEGETDLAEEYYKEAKLSGILIPFTLTASELSALDSLPLGEAIDQFEAYINYKPYVWDNRLGIQYLNRSRNDSDRKLGFLYVLRAALQDNARAENNMGLIYEFGMVIDQDSQKSVAWWEDAAAGGLTEAMLNLVDYYEKSSSHETSFLWLKKAAEEDDLSGQYLLADRYRDGVGVEQDIDEAAYWYTNASDAGSSYAEEQLIELGF